jgi:hypothetical protein
VQTETRASAGLTCGVMPLWTVNVGVFIKRRAFLLAMIGTLSLGVAARAYYVIVSDFPLNDGGLFYVMVRDLQAAGYHLPLTTTYNSETIPFTYPPLGFYIAGLLDDHTPLTLIDVFRFLPLAATLASLGVFVLIARALLPERTTLVVATLAFALVPRSFIWLLMGGGVTRAPGFLFTLLSLYFAIQCLRLKRPLYAPASGIFLGLISITHIGTVPFALVSLLLILLRFGGGRSRIAVGVTIALTAAVLASPWLVTVLAAHGLEPFRAAQRSGDSVFSGDWFDVVWRLAHFDFGSTGEPLFPIINAVALLGAMVQVTRGRWFLPGWWLLTIVSDIREGATYATLPISLLAGVAVAEILLPALKDPVGSAPRRRLAGVPMPPRGSLLQVVTTGGMAAYAIFGAFHLTDSRFGGDGVNLVGLTYGEQLSIRAAANSPRSARFVVVTGETWASDRYSEWFPVLANRTSVATVQGSEWLPGGAFQAQEHAYADLQLCAGQTSACLDDWSATQGIGFDHVYIPTPTYPYICCAELFNSLMGDPRYEGHGINEGWIFAKRQLSNTPAAAQYSR